MSEPNCVWQVGATLAEGPVWVEREQALYFVDIKSHAIHRYDPVSGEQKSWVTPGQPGFIFPNRSGGFVVGMGARLCQWNGKTGDYTLLVSIPNHPPGDRINDGYVDARGRLWFGTLNESNTMTTGKLYRYDGGAERAVPCDDGYIVSNGPVISPDGATLYHSNSLEGVIYAFDLAGDGGLSGKRPFVRYGDNLFPDGMAIDANGDLWVAVFNGWRVDRLSPAGERLACIPFPCAQVTKPAFGGRDLKTLFVTTARLGLSADDVARQPLAGSLFSLDVGAGGCLPTETAAF